MKELEILMARRWVLKAEDRQLYYRVREALPVIRSFATEKLGCQVIENASLIKLEKIPVLAEPAMGIREFSTKEEYAFLCLVLMFLEDRDIGEPFILSQFTEYVVANLPGGGVDWTHYRSRQQLVRVLRFATAQGMLRVRDGNEDNFVQSEVGEVLYENTGVSRYFMRHFPRDIMNYSRPEDFAQSDWVAMDEERGIARRHRVYRRLLFSMGILQSEGMTEDVDYLKNYGRRLKDELEKIFDGELHVHRGNAFFMQGESCHIGETLPNDTGLSDVLLLVCAEIREQVRQEIWLPEKDDRIQVTLVEFEQLLRKIRREQGAGFMKSLRDLTDGEFVRRVETEMTLWRLLAIDEAQQLVMILPMAGKIIGRYPQDYQGGIDDEQ